LWLKDVILFGVGTGLRLSEITSLRWRDVDFVSGFLTVRNHETFKTKSGHERSIPLVGDALSTLIKRSESSSTSTDDWVFTNGKGTRLVSGYVSKRFKYYVRLAKLPEEIHFHTLRHTCASWLAQNGVSLLTIQKILGHSDFRDTLIYSHLQPSVMKDAMVTTFGSGN